MFRAGVLAALCLVAPALAVAQVQRCERPLRPHVPVGAFAERWQMEQAKDAVESYLRDMQSYRECLVSEHKAAGAEAKRIYESWNETVNAYTSR